MLEANIYILDASQLQVLHIHWCRGRGAGQEQGKENLYGYPIPWYISQQVGICSKIISAKSSTYNMPDN